MCDVVTCGECLKPRCIYSAAKLSSSEIDAVSLVKEDNVEVNFFLQITVSMLLLLFVLVSDAKAPWKPLTTVQQALVFLMHAFIVAKVINSNFWTTTTLVN